MKVVISLVLLAWLAPKRGNSIDVTDVAFKGLETPEDSNTTDSNVTHVVNTIDLSRNAVARRQAVFGAIIAACCLLLLLAGIGVFLKRSKSTQAQKMALETGTKRQSGVARDGGGAGYKALPSGGGLDAEADAGLGALTAEELREAEEQIEQQNANLSPEERKRKIAEWAQANAEQVRAKYEVFLRRRWWVLVALLIAYMVASVGIPLLHRSEASCSRGFFWETHVKFLALLVLTKVIELWLCMEDPTVEWSMSTLEFFIKFLPSFVSYVDGYTDSSGAVIANSCNDPLAQHLGLAMAVCYGIGVIGFQWLGMLIFAARDPSHACLLKLLHMDLLASCITLPPEQKWTWDMISYIRTFGEDLPQAIFQTIYLVYVRENLFMLVSVVLAVMSSLKALYDARTRALAAKAAAEEYEQRERRTQIYSCSQDGTIRIWDVKQGTCTSVIDTGNCANMISASRGMLYSAHDDGQVREWSLETSQMERTFEHPMGNGTVTTTLDKAYTWAHGSVIKEWSLDTGLCTREFEAPPNVSMKCTIFVKGLRLYASAPDDPTMIAEWSLDSGLQVRSFEGHDHELNVLFATKKRLFSGSRDGTVKEWSLEGGECTRTFGDHSPRFQAGLLVVKSSLFHAAAEEPVINERSLATGELLRKFAGHAEDVVGMILFNGKLYSASADTTIKEWDIDTGLCQRTFEGHTDYVNNLVVMCEAD